MEEHVKWLVLIVAVMLCLVALLLATTLWCRTRCRRKRNRRCVRDSSILWQPVKPAPTHGSFNRTTLIAGARNTSAQKLQTLSNKVGAPKASVTYSSESLASRHKVQEFTTRSLDNLDTVPFSSRVTKPVPVQLSKRHQLSSNGSISLRDNREDAKPKDIESHLQCSSDVAEMTRRSLAAAGPTPEFLAEDWSTPTRQPTIEFSVTYVSSSKAFIVHVTRIINLSVKACKPSSTTSVKVKLLRLAGGDLMESTTSSSSNAAAAVVVDSSKHVFDAEKGTYYAFSGHKQEDLRQYSLRVSVYEGRFKILLEKRVGIFEFSLAQLELASDVPVTCIQKLTTSTSSKGKRAMTKEEKLLEENSHLMLSLFYQTSANRINVLIRKAVNLPKKKRRLGQPEYYVVVNAVSCGNVIATRETKSVAGQAPIWNQPFIFDLPEKDVDKYFLQFVVMSQRLGRQDGIIGQVVVGPDVRGAGHAHWNEAFEPRATEAVKWHKLQPL